VETAEAARMRVLLFGLSANPPTGLSGHAGIVRWAATEAKDVDEVWVLPVYRHAFADKREMPIFEHRMNMARLAFENLEGVSKRVIVKDTEKKVAQSMPPGVTIGTIDVVRELMKAHPDVEFSLLLGSDTHRDLISGKWKEAAALLDLVPVVVIARQGIDPPAFNAISIPGLADTSSSRVRQTTDRAELERALQPEVLSYIRDHHLYAFSDA
jgi:nicotinate-nucleotide adenylyltransferase